MSILEEKTIVLGVTGSIAAYKAAELTRRLVKSGAVVKVIMTKAATHFIAPLTFKALSCNPVATDLFQNQTEEDYHISLAQEADMILVAPVTANVLAKVAHGIADDLLTTTILACSNPVIFAPAMNKQMYLNPITQQNMASLKERGHQIIEPEKGELACGEVGVGRLAEIEKIMEALVDTFEKVSDLKGIKILISAGGTQEPIDPIRFIGNKSSGRMGYSLAEVALMRGAQVTLVSAPTALRASEGINFVPVTTVKQMRDEIVKRIDQFDVIIKAAAVSDFQVAKISKQKIKKQDRLALELVLAPDILAELGRMKKDQVLVGFAAESENLITNAKKKMKSKNLDLIVANDISRKDTGIGQETNQVTIIDRTGNTQELPDLPKQEVAQRILDEVIALIKSKKD